MDYSIALALHALAAAAWVGGLLFARAVLAPAAGGLEPPQRLALMARVFPRFFAIVGVSAVVLLATGYYILFGVFGGFGGSGIHVHIMHLLGWVMIGLAAWAYHGPQRRFARAVASGETEIAAAQVGRIRHLISVNLVLGAIVIVLGAAGQQLD